MTSKAQYELQFKKWRLRKNLSRKEWISIIKYIRERKITLERAEAFFNGASISRDRILREIARYGPAIERAEKVEGKRSQLATSHVFLIDTRDYTSPNWVRNTQCIGDSRFYRPKSPFSHCDFAPQSSEPTAQTSDRIYDIVEFTFSANRKL